MFGSQTVKLVALLVAVAGIFAGGFAAGHRWERTAFEHYRAEVAQANEKALEAAVAEQKRLDGIATAAAQKEAATQTAMTAAVKRQLAQVQKHVKDHGCLTLGFVRVLDAAARGIDADALVLPAGKSDDACAPADAAAVARSIIDNYGTARANAEQLDALIGAYRASRQ